MRTEVDMEGRRSLSRRSSFHSIWPVARIVRLQVTTFRLVPSKTRVPVTRGLHTRYRVPTEGDPVDTLRIESEPAGYKLSVDRFAYLDKVITEEAAEDDVTPFIWDILESMVIEMVRVVGTPRHCLWQAWVEPRPVSLWESEDRWHLDKILEEAHR